MPHLREKNPSHHDGPQSTMPLLRRQNPLQATPRRDQSNRTMSFSATISVPISKTLVSLLSTEQNELKRSTTTITHDDEQINISIVATDYTALRATTNWILQTIAVHNNVKEATA